MTGSRGKLTYGANWNEVERVQLWDSLDYIGVQFYAPLEAVGQPSNERERRAELARELDAIERVARRAGRKVLFTEVGYRSITKANLAPRQWPEHVRAEPDERAQALAYTRFFRAIARRDVVEGVYLWKWFSDPDSREEGADGFSPRSKLAADVMRAAFLGVCHTRARLWLDLP